MTHYRFMAESFAAALAIALLFLAWTFPAFAHDALPTAAKPNGWKYPYACCSGVDCREVTMGPQGTVREKGNGYEIVKTGEVLSFGDPRIKESPDGSTHWCSVAGLEDSRTICLFVPPRSY